MPVGAVVTRGDEIDRRSAQCDARLDRSDRPCRDGGDPRRRREARHLAARRLHLVGDARALRDVRGGDCARADEGAALRRRGSEGRRRRPRRRASSPSRPATIAPTCSAGSARRKRPSCCAASSPSGASSAGVGNAAGSRSRRFAAFWVSSVSGIVKRRALAEALATRSAPWRRHGRRDRSRPLPRACPTAPGCPAACRTVSVWAKHVDEGLVAGLHRPRDLQQRRVELRLHAGAARIEREARRNSDDDAAADLEHVEPDAGGLGAQLAVELGHISRRCVRRSAAGFSRPASSLRGHGGRRSRRRRGRAHRARAG